MALTLVFSVTTILLLATTFRVLFYLKWVRRLPVLAEDSSHLLDGGNEAPVRRSVVLAARDEEARIENTVRRLLAQRGVQLEILVVDDRSADRTGETLRRLAMGDARVRVKRVDVWLTDCSTANVYTCPSATAPSCSLPL